MEEVYPRIASRQFFHQRKRAVLRAVIHKDDLDIGKALSLYGSDAPRQKIFGIVDRYHYGNTRHPAP
jgi:ribosomal protein S19E (S16A)